MALPYSLTTNIDGLSAWCYDFNRSPKNTTAITNICTNADGDYIVPVSKTFVKYDDNVHQVRLVCDINHHFPGSGKVVFENLYGLANKWLYDYFTITVSSSDRYYSQWSVDNLRPVDKVRIYADSNFTLEHDSKTAITTTSEGVTLPAQTGIVHKNRGTGYIVLTLADGYKIPAHSTITVNGTYQGGLGGNVVSGTNSTFKTDYDMTAGSYLMRITDNKNMLTCSVDFPTVSSKPKHKITWHLTNCTVSPADTELDEGSHTWTFKANSGYRFDQDGEIGNAMGLPIGTIPATGTDTINWTYDLKSNVDVTLTANEIPQTVTTIPLSQKLTHATSNVSGAEIDRKLNQLTLTADSGYIFKDDILVQLFTGSNVTQSFNVAGDNKNSVTITFNTNTQNTITDSMTNIVITATAVKPEVSTGYAHYYAITNTELHSFSKENIWNFTGGDTETSYDVSKYIDNLIELPFGYDTTDLPTSTIAVGRVATATTSHELKDRFYTIDFGKIVVPAKYKNGYDYQIRTCKLYLPFAPAVLIDIANAMEQTIHIVYKIDMSNGNATITLDNNGNPFNTININIANQLPFLNTLQNTVIKDGSHQIYNGIRNPYLVITRQQPILNADFYPTNEVGKVTSYSGRLKATMPDNSGITDSIDFADLQNLLAEGVVYNA